MNAFSKPIRSEKTGTIITYNDYYNKKIDIAKYKIPELKEIAKQNKLHISGNKPTLIERIKTFFHRNYHSTKIQKIFRGFIVRLSFKLRGGAFKDRKICVNETDFYTLEPLTEIPYDDFFSYTDSKNFTYGFNFSSLIILFKQQGTIMNPYNREKVDFSTMNRIFTLHKLMNIIFKSNENQNLSRCSQRPRSNSSSNDTRPRTNSVTTNTSYHNYNNRQRELYISMDERRVKPVIMRIRELFMEIDLLGNYTQSAWFENLEKRDYARYYRYIHDIWTYRAQLSQEIKNKICCIYDPFTNARIHSTNYETITIEDLRKACLTIMENLVFTGIDTEYRKLGTLHALSALTIVSIPARNSMAWLYESLIY